MGKMKELLIDTETGGLDGKPEVHISITDLPRVMAEHQLKQGKMVTPSGYVFEALFPEPPLLEKIFTYMQVAVIRDQFYQMTKSSDKVFHTPIIGDWDIKGSKYVDPKTFKKESK